MPARIDPVTGRGYRFIDRTGERRGRLVFTQYLGRDKHKHSVWRAVCDCGNFVEIATSSRTKSCGCLRREVAAQTQRDKALPPEVKLERVLANRMRQRQRRMSDPALAMQARLSRLHRLALAKVGAIKTSPTFEQLGYTVDEFITHLERQFLPGMSWDNMDRWQIDHIVPSSEAKTVEDVVRLNQLSNLRPMWAEDNNKKKNKRVTLL